jgi:hypothetical protein
MKLVTDEWTSAISNLLEVLGVRVELVAGSINNR